ncbi:MAG: formamidopyrimidine-DNA glycosylase [bacterium]|nr:formamidopyrimidine-DNA glycosylase [bacterium]MDE0290589.1 formamidopyrimidine-DNA glycosylase [bacterium]MDE0439927.1 formamidopyrimidine-DNA glycosylase [bacterium]
MPELPDVVVYLEAFDRFIGGRSIERARVTSVSLLRTYDPPLHTVEGRRVVGLSRMGKRVVWELDNDMFMVFHLMIAGRFRWRNRGAAVPRKVGHAGFDFANGTVILTEQGSKKRASLHVHRGREALSLHERGGVEPLEVGLPTFAAALTRENRTLKRALTDPRIFSGIGNAYSDEILHRAGLSPVKLTGRLTDPEVARLHAATRSSLTEWIGRLREEVGEGFPEKVTAFRPEMAVHGKYKASCPVCGDAVRRIVYAANETNYCATCQTGGRILADRALSRLLKDDWPR